jgi:hypothetical protein
MGEMSKVEEVARAIFDAMDVADGLDGTVARKYAVAAIETLRDANLIYAVLEPRTEADEIAGRREFYGDSGAWLSLWNSAIDAALKE